MQWHRLDIVPGFWFAFCPDARTWAREMKKLKVDAGPYPTTDARCTRLARGSDEIDIITIGEHKRTSRAAVVLLVHESMHIWRHCRQLIGEHEPSSEFEAYAVQTIFDALLQDFQSTRKAVLR
jgi:hypothetical protein